MGRLVVCAVALPPPLSGQSAVNQAVVAKLVSTETKSLVIDLSPGTMTRSIDYHFTRVTKVLACAVKLLTSPMRGDQSTCLYTVVESGFGIFYNAILVIVARSLRLPIFLHHHTSGHTLQYRSAFGCLARVAGRSAKHFVLGREMADDLLRLYPCVESVAVAGNACHVLPEVSPRRRTGPTFCVGLLSNLNAEKGLDLAISTVLECRARGCDVALILAGPLVGPDAEKSVVQAQKVLGDRLQVIGPVSGKAKWRFFADIDLFFFPTSYRYEAQPMVVLEAMSCGVPVLTTAQGYIRELVGDSGTVLSADLVTSSYCSDLIESWSKDRAALTEMGAAGQTRFDCLQREAQIQLRSLVEELADSRS